MVHDLHGATSSTSQERQGEIPEGLNCSQGAEKVMYGKWPSVSWINDVDGTFK
jgi:hypothetical protein